VSSVASAQEATEGESEAESATQEETAVPQREAKVSREGPLRGAYWWAEPDAGALAAFGDFGVDTVAFRLGRLEYVRATSAGASTGTIGWRDRADSAVLAELSPSLSYRPVIETDSDFWRKVAPDDVVSFLSENVASLLGEESVKLGSVELRLPDAMDANELESFLMKVKDAELPMEVEIGVDPSLIGSLGRARLESLAPMIDGVVIYFLDYDLGGLSPRIADRAWISEVCVEISSLGIPFTAVLPTYNRAIRFPARSGAPAEILPAIDLAGLSEVSEERRMGAAGTEYTVVGPVSDSLSPLGVGDRIRVLESLEELDLQNLTSELPSIAPLCREIDLFRFPLVPGFDPDPTEVLGAAGWARGPSEETVDPLAAARKELDQKYNKGQQFILMLTIGFMVILLMRMFARGQPAKGGGGGGSK
jgi:hypothetical protein